MSNAVQLATVKTVPNVTLIDAYWHSGLHKQKKLEKIFLENLIVFKKPSFVR